MTYVGATPTTGDFKKLDSITTSSATTFNLRQGGVAVYPQSANHCIVSLNGVIQAPIDAFTIVNDTIVFASSLASSDVINFILVLGNVNDIGTVSDDTVSQAKIQSEAINEAKMQISNAGTNGQYLQKQTGNTGGLTWADAGGASLTGSTNNTVVTVTGADAMQGEANLTHDGTTTTMKATAGASGTETAVITTANNANPAYANLVFKTGGNTSGVWLKGVQASGGNDGRFEIHTNNSGTVGERVRIPFNGGVLVSTTTDDGNSLTGGGDFGAIVNCQSGKTPGFAFQSDGLVINRSDADNNNRDVVMFYRNGSNAGNISASNSSVTYGTFLGVHYAQLTDDSKPDILVGTVMESINETSEWHMAQFTVPEYTEDGVTYPSQVLKRYIPKTNSVGDNIKFKWHKNYKEGDADFETNAVEYDAVVIKENDEEYLARVKVSDTEDSKAVYGVFESWMESEANDIQVGSLGAFMIRVHKDETFSIGDY